VRNGTPKQGITHFHTGEIKSGFKLIRARRMKPIIELLDVKRKLALDNLCLFSPGILGGAEAGQGAYINQLRESPR
jgi:hypothetical protein